MSESKILRTNVMFYCTLDIFIQQTTIHFSLISDATHVLIGDLIWEILNACVMLI